MMAMGRPIIHVVEDDAATRTATGELLAISGFVCKLYEAAEPLLDAVDRGSLKDSETHCVLGDLRLPGLSGLQLFQELRNRGIRVCYILISGHADDDTVKQANEMGIQHVLLKPATPALLIETLNNALGAAQP